MIQNINTKEEESRCIKHKFKDKADLIDMIETDDAKRLKKIALSMKYYYGLNYYGERNKKINRRTIAAEYLKYSSIELQKYIVQYQKTIGMRNEFILNMHKELK